MSKTLECLHVKKEIFLENEVRTREKGCLRQSSLKSGNTKQPSAHTFCTNEVFYL